MPNLNRIVAQFDNGIEEQDDNERGKRQDGETVQDQVSRNVASKYYKIFHLHAKQEFQQKLIRQIR